MNCILYLRVSSEEQVQNFSLVNQEEFCRNEATRKGYPIIRIFREEGASAKNITGRPELIKLLAFCEENKARISALLVYKIDRLARETSDYLVIRKKLSELGIQVISCTEPTEDSPTGKFFETVMASVAELDNSMRGERTKQGLKQRFLQGFTINKPPLGYTWGKVEGKNGAVPKEPEFSIVKRCFEVFSTGAISLQALAEKAKDWGLKSGRNRTVRSQTLSRILSNPFYYGVLKYKAYPEEVLGKHIPMISEDLFFRVRSFADGRNNTLGHSKRRVDNPLFPLRGLVRCSCGARLVSGNCRGSSKVYPLYWCNKKHGAKSIHADALENLIKDLLGTVQPQKECKDLFLAMLKRNLENRIYGITKARKRASLKEEELTILIASLTEEHLKKDISDEVYRTLLKKYDSQLVAARIAKNDHIVEKYDLEGTVAFMKVLLNDLQKAYDSSNYSQKRALLISIFPKGLEYFNGTFLNPEISPVFRDIREPMAIKMSSGVADAI